MLKLAYKVGSRGGAMVSTSARNAGDPWFESRSWYDRFLYVNIHLFILMPVSCNTSNLLIYIYIEQSLRRLIPKFQDYSFLLCGCACLLMSDLVGKSKTGFLAMRLMF